MNWIMTRPPNGPYGPTYTSGDGTMSWSTVSFSSTNSATWVSSEFERRYTLPETTVERHLRLMISWFKFWFLWE